MATSRRSRQTTTDGQICLLAALPANPSASPDSERAWQTNVAISPSNILGSLTDLGPSGWFGRTSPASCQAMEDGTLVPFSGAWSNSGMGSPTECLTLSTSDAPHPARASYLSDIVETGDLPPQLFLKKRHWRSILTKAHERQTSPASTLPEFHAALACCQDETASEAACNLLVQRLIQRLCLMKDGAGIYHAESGNDF